MKKVIKIWLMYGAMLALLILGSCVHEEQRNASVLASQLEVAYEEIADRGTIIKQQEFAIRELETNLDGVIDKLQIIATFQDASLPVTSSDVRALLDLTASLPYGSPFPSGHLITSRFGLRSISRYGWVDQKHLGIDLLPLDGDPTIIAPADCYITDHGWSDLYGNYIEMETITGYRLFMAHLDRIYWPHVDKAGVWSLDPAKIVPKGTRIANMGQSGAYATGVHLHYEIWIKGSDDSWIPLDPEDIINFVGEDTK